MSKMRGIFVIFVAIFAIVFVSAASSASSISFVSPPTPADGGSSSTPLIYTNVAGEMKNYTYRVYSSSGLVATNNKMLEDVGVSAGQGHTCILKSNGNVNCYGDNTYGQANNYTLGDAIGVSAGDTHTCVLKSNGNVNCYGLNLHGKSNNYALGDAVGVSAGGYHTCVLKSNGNVSCYGWNENGLSNNYTLGDAVGVSAGGYHTCVLKSNGNVSCYGFNSQGQSNNYTLGDAVGVSAGRYHTCVLKSNGNVSCYGDIRYGEAINYNLGDAVGVSAGQAHTCVLKSNGNVSCYGYNSNGQANNYTLGDAVGVSAGGYHTCVLKSNGNVTCYGEILTTALPNYTLGDAQKTGAYPFLGLPTGSYSFNATACNRTGCFYSETRRVTIGTVPGTSGTVPFTSKCSDSQRIMALSNYTNAHGALWNLANGYSPIEICYSDLFENFSVASGVNPHDCSVTANTKLVYLSGNSNAHANESSSSLYAIGVCYSGFVSCTIKTGACTGVNTTAIVYLSNKSNAHISKVGNANHPWAVCCKGKTPLKRTASPTTGCISYKNEDDCNDDDLLYSRGDPLCTSGGAECGCSWTKVNNVNKCIFKKAAGECSCVYSGEGACDDEGNREVSAIKEPAGCDDQGIDCPAISAQCGFEYAELPFFGAWQLVASALGIVLVYALGRKNE